MREKLYIPVYVVKNISQVVKRLSLQHALVWLQLVQYIRTFALSASAVLGGWSLFEGDSKKEGETRTNRIKDILGVTASLQ